MGLSSSKRYPPKLRCLCKMLGNASSARRAKSFNVAALRRKMLTQHMSCLQVFHQFFTRAIRLRHFTKSPAGFINYALGKTSFHSICASDGDKACSSTSARPTTTDRHMEESTPKRAPDVQRHLRFWETACAEPLAGMRRTWIYACAKASHARGNTFGAPSPIGHAVAAVLWDARCAGVIEEPFQGARALRGSWCCFVGRYLRSGVFQCATASERPTREIELLAPSTVELKSTRVAPMLVFHDACPRSELTAIDVSSGETSRTRLTTTLFAQQWQTCVCDDGHVFIACGHIVAHMTPDMRLDGKVIVSTPCDQFLGVAADDARVYVSSLFSWVIHVYDRRTTQRLFTFGSRGTGDGDLLAPRQMCLTGPPRSTLAVCDAMNHRVAIFARDGMFLSCIGADRLRQPDLIACSRHGEIVVADGVGWWLFGARGALLAFVNRSARHIPRAIHVLGQAVYFLMSTCKGTKQLNVFL